MQSAAAAAVTACSFSQSVDSFAGRAKQEYVYSDTANSKPLQPHVPTRQASHGGEETYQLVSKFS
jgi:hypothetical protein